MFFISSVKIAKRCSVHYCDWKYLLENSLLAGEGEGQVDAVHGHPVDVTLPALPAPPHRGVADSAHVLIVPKPQHTGKSLN